MSSKKSQFIWNMIGLTMNSFNSLFFLMIVNRINGLEDAGIFTFAFSLAGLFFVVGIYAGRTYQVTDISDTSDYEYVTHRIITCIIMVVLTLGYALVNSYSYYKFSIILLLCLYRMLEAFGDAIYGIMQKRENLDKVGKSLFIKSLLSLIVFTIVDFTTHNLLLACITMCISTIVILIVYDRVILFRYNDLKKSICSLHIKKLFIGGFNIFLFTFLCMYLTNAPKYVMDGLLADEFQAIFGIIIMPGTIVSLCAQYMIGPYLNTMTTYIQSGLYKDFHRLVLKLGGVIAGLGIVGATMAFIIGIPVLELVYGTKLSGYQGLLALIIIGATLYTLCNLISTVLIALRETKVQLVIYIIGTVFAFAISTLLINQFAIQGAGYAYFVTMLLLFIMFIFVYLYLIGKLKRKADCNE